MSKPPRGGGWLVLHDESELRAQPPEYLADLPRLVKTTPSIDVHPEQKAYYRTRTEATARSKPTGRGDEIGNCRKCLRMWH